MILSGINTPPILQEFETKEQCLHAGSQINAVYTMQDWKKPPMYCLTMPARLIVKEEEQQQ
jgi:hypothetical protein